MAYKITVANIKGGIGKTTTVINLADQLVKRGKRVLTIDMDPQRNTTTVFNAKMSNAPTMYDIIFSNYTAAQCIQHTVFGDIIPNDTELRNSEGMVKPGPAMYKYIKRILPAIEDDYDYILFDTPPYDGILLGNALMASDGIVIPIECDLFSVQGLADFNKSINEFIEDNTNLKILGILIIKYKANQNLTKELESDTLVKLEKLMKTEVFPIKIRESVKCKTAMACQQRLSVYAPGCTVEEDYNNLTDYILKEV